MKEKNENFISNNDLLEVKLLLKRYNNFDQSNPFVGSQFKTPKGGVLTVVGWDGVSKCGSGKKFTCHCSICNEDKELFPDEFIILKSGLINGYIPCGCSKNTILTKDQNIVRVQRECYKRGYIFHGFVGEWSGNKTYLDLENTKTNNRWCSTNLNSFLNGCGDPVERALKTKKVKLKDDAIHIQNFNMAGFTEDYKFWRSAKLDKRGYKPYWYYTCPECSNDEYVKAGVCTGVFENHTSSLRKGLKACRCSASFHWSKEQREYQINKICKEEGLTFLGWETNEEYRTHESKFKWVCSQVHECCTSVSSFLNGSKRCKTCRNIKQRESGNGNGYYPERRDEIDFLYVINFNNEYIKVGRSFDVLERIKGSKGLLKCSGMTLDQLTILKVFTATHQEIYDTEQWIHGELTERGFYHNESDWTIETFDTDSERLIYKLLSESDLVETDIPSITKD